MARLSETQTTGLRSGRQVLMSVASACALALGGILIGALPAGATGVPTNTTASVSPTLVVVGSNVVYHATVTEGSSGPPVNPAYWRPSDFRRLALALLSAFPRLASRSASAD